jgi:hypothetical protein
MAIVLFIAIVDNDVESIKILRLAIDFSFLITSKAL